MPLCASSSFSQRHGQCIREVTYVYLGSLCAADKHILVLGHEFRKPYIRDRLNLATGINVPT